MAKKEEAYNDTLDDAISNIMKDETAQSQAVKSLIEVKDRQIGKLGSEIELKTDLTERDVCLHTAIDMMANILEMDKESFSKKSIIGNLTTLKERKLLSKDRKSRQEIVEVAKSPDMNMMSNEPQSMVKRWFGSKKPDNVPR